jgi:hypothetical protein
MMNPINKNELIMLTAKHETQNTKQWCCVGSVVYIRRLDDNTHD